MRKNAKIGLILNIVVTVFSLVVPSDRDNN